MDISGIDHIELYVGDARQTAFYLCTAFGFKVCGQGGPETGLPGRRSLLLRQGGIQVVLTSGLVADHPATEYVRRHGDGVAVIGIGVDDAAAAYRTLVGRGAEAVAPPAQFGDDDQRVVVAEVSGFSDVTHRLVERHGPGREFLPGAIEVTEPDPHGDGKLLRTIDHIAICVPAGGLAPTARYYVDVFGFEQIFEEYVEVGGQGMDSKVVQSPSGHVTFTLIEPDPERQPGQIDNFLTWHAGAGVQHVAFGTDDIVKAVTTLADHGVRFLGTPAGYYDSLEERVGHLDAPVDELRRLGVLVDRDHWGQLLQIFTESMHVRRTLFLEIIERRGALTFGSGNIKALYEAKRGELADRAAVGKGK
ncbi:4-hydroxyphenylpyruvate dioxygenase [Saccharothrix syringae]|uniref:4-hydroxyphenylpyruvate dioxygenase n=1 Tax=Saccharothrix syringae TaxID=103733 RepID=A0A5Q0H5V0_SACSY|nr:4-hydroxyphenylpyruvate dioxygenase [Saccharothrix syringae]QFZ21220.1 4-hydroxyphenylpyruvate dioxygenase [Saccharothrix syringae]